MEDEQILVRDLAKGSIQAFNSLFREYSGRLYRFANRYLRSNEESEEVVQEVFTIIWERRTELKEELSFKSFLFTIAFNIIKKRFRSQSYLSEYLKSSLYSESDTSTSEKINCDSLNKFISELVGKLPSKRKEIFIKSRFEGLSINEISGELGISHKTVENQLSSALKFLRKKLDRE